MMMIDALSLLTSILVALSFSLIDECALSTLQRGKLAASRKQSEKKCLAETKRIDNDCSRIECKFFVRNTFMKLARQ